MKILMVSSEAVPFSKSGGLADVVTALSVTLASLGHEIELITPYYSFIETHWDLEREHSFALPFAQREEKVELHSFTYQGIRVHFVEHPLYSQRKGIYGDTPAESYMDNALRFSILAKSSIAYAKSSSPHFDVIHCHDWPSALLPYLLKQEDAASLRATKSLLTIHNLAYQGEFPRLDTLLLGLGNSKELFAGNGVDKKLNFLKSGIKYADLINTVSPTYAQEIQSPEYGCALDTLLRKRNQDLFGILNGIDTEEWNPAIDSLIPINFDSSTLNKKEQLKQLVQKEFGLEQTTQRPLVALISRLVVQKGFYELLLEPDNALEAILTTLPVQVVVVGTGELHLEERLEELSQCYDNLGLSLTFSNELAHLVEAGSDFFLMPSRYEPCGLNQMYSLAYGTIPIVRNTGGLADSVIDLESSPKHGTGLLFEEMSGQAIYGAVKRAVQLYQGDASTLHAIRVRGMNSDFSWRASAAEYLRLYQFLAGGKR